MITLTFSSSFEHVFLTIGVGDKAKGLASQCKAQEKIQGALLMNINFEPIIRRLKSDIFDGDQV